jgi:hypothetical protein
LFGHVEPQGLKDGLPDDIKNFKYLDEDRRVWEFEKHSVVSIDGKDVSIVTRTLVLNTNYQHNKRLTYQDIANIVSVGARSSYHKVVYQLGRWGEVNDGEKYAHKFNEGTHVVPSLPLIKTLPLHYTVDFNVKPYMSGLVCQINYVRNATHKYKGFSNYVEIRVVKEFALKHPKNEAYYLGSELVANYGAQLQKGLYLYGDASGNNRLGTKDTKTLFDGVLKGFDTYRGVVQKRIPKSNPRYKNIAPNSLGRRDFLNAVLQGNYPVKIMIDRQCFEFIDDMRLSNTDANGKLDKKKTKGVELRGHLLQAFEYFLCHDETFAEYAKL